ncbi:hypothetical protein [Sphingobium yanoikuyae]|uniref:Uncharacterized protein n=1 Tax=Sphingobium yanoikuyae TaxID=13690 RepID=A0A085K856_SPHYA|nr:hypothetical protein [Sphingobium yanoikuyae]ATI79206.1 hypothetical protein A6768_03705 [Sphingobium yanoikuyae]KEZ17634.1 hypothetical protein CP98_03381 [Sphingobium yanoikuyae]KFD28902.1 hypothetical protein IH86_06725 [Sphingobium yanoikuyae]KZC81054.1 hypothetical protein AYR46_09075 [Sphingobium yanoikuyae]MDV3478834.1 hypothetical protein [Sphingobium yanoikuyae]
MRFGRSTAVAAILAIGALPAALPAQTVNKPSKAQIDSAAYVLQVISSALESKDVEQPVKTALFECLYSNSLSQISAATDKVIAGNPGKVNRKDPSQMLAVIAGTCGYRPAAAKPAPKK